MAWALLPRDTVVDALVGRSLVARGDDERRAEVVLAARVARVRAGVSIRWSTLSPRLDPLLAGARDALGDAPEYDPLAEERGVHVPPGAPIDAALLAATGVRISHVAVADVRWPRRARHLLAAGLTLAAAVATVLATWLSGDAGRAWAWAIVAGVAALLVYSQVADAWGTPPARVRGAGRVLSAGDVAAGLAAASPVPPGAGRLGGEAQASGTDPASAPLWGELPLDTRLDALGGTSFLAASGTGHVLGTIVAPTNPTALARVVEAWVRRDVSVTRVSREVPRHQTLRSCCLLLGVAPGRAMVVPRVDWLRDRTPGVRVGETWWDADALLARMHREGSDAPADA